MLDWLLREEQGALHYPFDVVVGEFSAMGLAGELDALAGQPGTALSIDKRPSEGCGLHLRGDARDVLYKRSWRRLFSFAPCTVSITGIATSDATPPSTPAAATLRPLATPSPKLRGRENIEPIAAIISSSSSSSCDGPAPSGFW